MVSDKFRRQLRREAQQWQAEEVIDADLYQQLANRYQFNELETEARNSFVMILLGLGGVLLGLAVIVLIAANWQVWPREVKAVLLLGLFIAINVGGFYLWRRSGLGWSLRIGKGLLLFGSLTLGANIALMSQMFHQSGPVYQLFLIWALGVVVMAYGLRLTLLGMLAVILTTIGYIWGWGEIFTPYYLSPYQIALHHIPLISAVVFLPLAYFCRSRWIFGMGAVLSSFSLVANLSQYWHLGIIVAIAALTPAAFWWAYRDTLWRQEEELFAPIARGVSLFYLSFSFYISSFHHFWRENPLQNQVELSSFHFSLLGDGLIFLGLTIWVWWNLGRSSQPGRSWRLDSNSATLAVMILTYGVLLWWQPASESVAAIATLIANILLTLLGIGLIRNSLDSGKRLGFWWGMFLIVLQICSRMLEYQTELVFKAFVLFLCGVGVILAGLWFERHVRSFQPEADSSNS